jgi:hypothetical protein
MYRYMSSPPVREEDRARRNERFAMLRARGVTWRKIARDESVSVASVQRGVAAHERTVAMTEERARLVLGEAAADLPEAEEAAALADVESPAMLDAGAIYLVSLREILAAMDQLGDLSRTADHAGARVGAAKGRLQAAQALSKTLALVGLLPDADLVLLARAERRRVREQIRGTEHLREAA